MVCVRPILMMCANSFSFAANASYRRDHTADAQGLMRRTWMKRDVHCTFGCKGFTSLFPYQGSMKVVLTRKNVFSRSALIDV